VTATPGTDGNSNSCSWDITSFTATECRPYHPHEDGFQDNFRTVQEEINNYKS
jgi:hypothetical protein